MSFRTLHLQNFRNWKNESADFSPRVNIFLGQNGQGKTNILEALYLVSQGETFRYADNENLIQTGANEAILRCRVQTTDLIDDLAVQILKSKKNFFLNNKKATSAVLADRIPVILFSPESLAAIKEGDDQRRQLLDEVVAATLKDGFRVLQDFRKSLRTRNRILKDAVEGKSSERQARDLLESVNGPYLTNAVELTSLRLEAIRGLRTEFQNTMRSIARDPNVDISVEYVVSGQNANNWSRSQAHDSMHKRAQELAAAELASGASLVGPHKHEVTFLYNQNDSRIFCSQGQQRALILAFKIAQIVYHRAVRKTEPVLMLDDVLSELDGDKRLALIDFLKSVPTQVFITTTDVSLPDAMSGMDLRVRQVELGHFLS